MEDFKNLWDILKILNTYLFCTKQNDYSELAIS